MLTMGSLFAGIGGFDLGFERAGFKTVWQVEINEYCRKVLARHFPDAERYADIRECGVHNLKPVDVICGGFPCQDISNAGLRAGIDGERSGLWREMHRIISELRPRYVVVENVAALLGRGISRVLGDLSEIGYDAEWQVISAADVGAPHLRERIWIMAYAGSEGRREDTGSSYADEGKHARRPTLQTHELAGDGQGCRARDVADADRGRCSEPQRWEVEQSRGAEIVGGSETMAYAGSARLPERVMLPRVSGEAQCGDEREAAFVGSEVGHAARELQHGSRIWTEQAGRRELTDAGWWIAEPNVGRVAHGVPAELDFIGRVMNGESDYTKADPETRFRVWQIVFEMWRNREVAKTSPDIYRRALHHLVPDLPQERAHSGWLLGSRIEEDEALCDLWQRVCAQPLEEAQDMLPELLERIGKKKRPEALGSRIDRLRALGNSVVPQIPELIARRLKEVLCP